MIELYISLSQKLSEIPELKLIDLDGTNEAKIYPAAFIALGKLNYEQLHAGAAIAKLPFTVKVELNPIHRSCSNSPMLDALNDSFPVVNAIKSKLIKEEINHIGGIMLTGEELKKEKGKYFALLQFVGTVEYMPD